MKRPFRLPVFAGLMVILAACGGTASVAPTSNLPQSIGHAESKLNLIAWAGYVDSGKSDPKVDWVTPFQNQTGCAINVKFADNSDQMGTLIRRGDGDAC